MDMVNGEPKMRPCREPSSLRLRIYPQTVFFVGIPTVY